MEPHLIGGECSFYACMPSKALLRPGELLAEVRRIPGVREAVTGDLDARGGARAARRDHPQPRRLAHGAVAGRPRGDARARRAARFDGERRVRVGDDTLVARRAVVVADRQRRRRCRRSTGCARPSPGPTARPPPPSRCPSAWRSSAAAWWAWRWRRRGAPRLAGHAGRGRRPRCSRARSRSPARRCEQALRERGVDVRKGAKATAVRARRRRGARWSSRPGGPVRGDELLVAIGRAPEHRRPRRRDDRPRAGQADRGGRPDARAERLALRDRRRQRPRAAHAHGQVPGPHRGRTRSSGRAAPA